MGAGAQRSGIVARLGDVVYWVCASFAALGALISPVGFALSIPMIGIKLAVENLAGGLAGVVGVYLFGLGVRYVLNGKGWRP
jgi:hypothetical protein